MPSTLLLVLFLCIFLCQEVYSVYWHFPHIHNLEDLDTSAERIQPVFLIPASPPPTPQQHVALNLHFLPLWLSMSMYLCLFSNCWRSRSFWEWVDHASQWTRLHFLGGKNMHRVQRANAFCSSSHRLLPSQVIGFSGNLQLLMKYRKSQVRLILNSQCCG